jgi:hypothetical protein
MRISIIMIVSIVMAIMPAQTALACTGHPEPISLNTYVENADYIVKATVVEVDDVSKNAILRVETYLTGGGGPEYLLLYRDSPELASVYYKHHYDTGCLYYGKSPIQSGFSAYFALKRNIYGAYETTYDSHYNFGFQELPSDYIIVGVKIDPDGNDQPDNLEAVPEDEQQFIELIAELTGETATEPEEHHYSSPLPFLTPLRITTDSGSQFIFPIDAGPIAIQETIVPQSEWSPIAYPDFFELPVYCAEVGCRLIAPDRSLEALQVDENTITVDYRTYIEGDFPDLITLEGQAFSFSPTSEAILVWNDDKLVAHIVSYTECGCNYGEFIPNLYPRIEIQLAENEVVSRDSLLGLAMWSADGSNLIYGDAKGVWLFDIFRQDEPELIASVVDGIVPVPLYVSTSGRYVAYSYDKASGNWATIDRMNGEIHGNALFSPNERHMVRVINRQNAEFEDGCSLEIGIGCSLIYKENTRYFEWIGRDQFFRMVCRQDQECHMSNSDGYGFGYSRLSIYDRIPSYRGYFADVDYEPEQELFAFVSGPQTITIGSTEYDLSGQLDGDIVDVEWMPSLFYRE